MADTNIDTSNDKLGGGEVPKPPTFALVRFDDAASRSVFAFWWQAHGNHYGIPCSIDDDIRLGRTVVCNTSRAVRRDFGALPAHLSLVDQKAEHCL